MMHWCPRGASLCSWVGIHMHPTVPKGCSQFNEGAFPSHFSYGAISPSVDTVWLMLPMSHAKFIASAHNRPLAPVVRPCIRAVTLSFGSPSARSATPFYRGVSGNARG